MNRTVLNRLGGYLRRNGVGATLRRCLQELVNSGYVIATVWRRPHFAALPSLLDFVYSPRATPIRPFQIRSEIASLLVQLAPLNVSRVLEIGTNNGGTLFLWPRVAAPDAMIISLDLPGGNFGGGYWAWRRPLYRAFALPGQTIHLLRSDSHDPDSLAAVQRLLGPKQLDYLMIDGDHTYEGVKRDHEMYGPLVRSGGLIAFHDIADHVEQSCLVRKYWLEISRGRAAREFCADPPAGWAGIGVLIQE